ncbi:hypothetical protein [Streptomyces prasinus]|nr:hypothetical protein [Streptomyces prasinus]
MTKPRWSLELQWSSEHPHVGGEDDTPDVDTYLADVGVFRRTGSPARW